MRFLFWVMSMVAAALLWAGCGGEGGAQSPQVPSSCGGAGTLIASLAVEPNTASVDFLLNPVAPPPAFAEPGMSAGFVRFASLDIEGDWSQRRYYSGRVWAGCPDTVGRALRSRTTTPLRVYNLTTGADGPGSSVGIPVQLLVRFQQSGGEYVLHSIGAPPLYDGGGNDGFALCKSAFFREHRSAISVVLGTQPQYRAVTWMYSASFHCRDGVRAPPTGFQPELQPEEMLPYGQGCASGYPVLYTDVFGQWRCREVYPPTSSRPH